MALPMPRPISGKRFAPKMMMTMARMTSSSGSPSCPSMVILLELSTVQERPGCDPRNGVNCTTRSWTRGMLAVAGFLVGFLIPTVAPAARAHATQFASGVSLVEVYVTVTDAQGQPVTGLTAADFSVFEDDEPQKIAAFARGEFPLAVALGGDRSFSMKGRP